MPAIDAEYVARMEDVLRLYHRPFDAKYPVVCFDERPVQLHDDARAGSPLRPGRARRYDYEYVRRGTANIFCIIEPLTGARLTHATRNRTGAAFAFALKRLSAKYPDAKRVHLVLDNLSTHSKKSLTDTLGTAAGTALWKRFRLHFTPKHGSWLNAAELEAGMVSRECLGKRRIGTLPHLRDEVRAWTARASRDRRTIAWSFTVHDARRVFRYAGIQTPEPKH